MGSIAAGDLTLLRSQQGSHASTEKLWIWGFDQMWTGRVNDGSIARGAQTVAFDGGAMQGSFQFSELTAGLMVWFGTSAGDDDLGRRILLSITGNATSGSIVVDWSDDNSLDDDDYITIILFRPPWPKLSWFTSADGFYKSGPPVSESGAGLDYSDQNTSPPPHVVMGRCAVYAPGLNQWWYGNGVISASKCVAAWQGVGASTQATSYTNLHNPGTNDLAAGSAPTWGASTGWTFNGSTQYLTTGVTPNANYTLAIRLNLHRAGGTVIAIGQSATNGANALGTSVAPGLDYYNSALWGDSSLAQYNQTALDEDSTLILSGGKFYYNGTLNEDLSLSNAYSGSPVALYLGATNTGAGAGSFWDDEIYLAAVYNTTLEANEVTALHTAMMAVTSSDAPGITVDAASSQPVADGASLSTYAWASVPTGVVFADSTASNTQAILVPGTKYYIECTVTDDNAKSSIGYRSVIADDPANTIAITEFERGALTERYNSYSVSCQITLASPDSTNTTAIRPSTDWSEIDSDVMAIITADDYYGTTKKTITFRDNARYTDRENIIYCGFVIGEKRTSGNNTASIQLTCVNAVDFFLYSLSITGVRTASDWYEMDSELMYVASLLFHLFKWHSTLLEISDWILPWSDTTLRSAVEEWTEGNIMDRARSFAGQHGRLMAITATTQGEFFVEEDSNLISESDRNGLTTTLTLDANDLVQDKQVNIEHRPKVSQVYLSGGVSQGVLGTFQPFLSVSQNVRKAQGVQAPDLQRLMLPDQTEANRLCGRMLAVLNRKIVDMNVAFSGNYREVFSPADQQWVNTGTEVFAASGVINLRGATDLNSIRMVPRQVTKNPPQSGYPSTSVIFDVEAPAGELTGRTITLKSVSPFYVAPEIEPGPPILGEPIDVAVTGDNANGVEVYIYDDATWVTRNTGLSGDSLKVRDLKIVPYWWLYQNSTDHEDCMLWIATDGGIYFSNDLGKSYINRTPLEALASAPAGVTPETVSYYAIDTYSVPTDINRVVVAMCREEVSGTIHSWLLYSSDGGRTYANVKRS